MSYHWNGMRKLEWEEVKRLHKKNELIGCFRLHNNDAETVIEEGYDFIDDILEHHEKGGEFGHETGIIETKLADGKKILAPLFVDLSELGCLDEMEYGVWYLIEEYMKMCGIRAEDDEPDWATVKEIQNCIFDQFVKAGISFKFGPEEENYREGKGQIKWKKEK